MLGQRGRRRPAGIDPAQATKLLSQGALLLDVSERDEWDAGHAPVARHVPLAELAGSMASLPPAAPLVVVCRSGRRSAEAAAVLLDAGFEALNLVGGMVAWAAAGYRVESARGAPGVVL